MGKIKNIFIPPFDEVKKTVDKWKPENCTSEKEYEMSLFKLLEENHPDYDIKNQYGYKFGKVDIVVNDKIAIELKYNFGKTDEFQRLIGQLVLYRDTFEYVIMGICGMRDKSLVRFIKKIAGEFTDDEFGDKIYVFEK